MFYVGQRVVCDRDGINSRFRLENGRIEETTHFDVQHDCQYGWAQRGGVYTVSKVGPKHIMLEEIPCVYVESEPEMEMGWWDHDLFRPFESSRRDLQWLELLERIREIACDYGVARRHDGKMYTYYGWKDAEVYSVAFKQFMGAQWDGSPFRRWTARDIFDAVNVVLSEADYNNCTLPDDCDWPPPGGDGDDKDRAIAATGLGVDNPS